MALIPPHASDQLQPLLVKDDERLVLQHYANNLPAITLSSRETGDLVMLGIGGFTPLYGFMREEDWRSVCDNMH